jgi:hypothetical protein
VHSNYFPRFEIIAVDRFNFSNKHFKRRGSISASQVANAVRGNRARPRRPVPSPISTKKPPNSKIRTNSAHPPIQATALGPTVGLALTSRPRARRTATRPDLAPAAPPPGRISRPPHRHPAGSRAAGYGEPDLAHQQAAAGLHGTRRPRRGERAPHALGLAPGHRRRRRTGARLLPRPDFLGWRRSDPVPLVVPRLRGADLPSCSRVSCGWRLGSHSAVRSAITASAGS